jgi:hypothetical protein
VCGSTDVKALHPRCLGAARQVNNKAGRGIYLVDNEQGGVDSACADVYCAELELLQGLFKLFFNPCMAEAAGGGYLMGVLRTP